MPAIQLHQYGVPPRWLADHASPQQHPLPRWTARVRMIASPIHPSDLLMLQGLYPTRPPLPCVPGFEGVGVVEEVNPSWLGSMLKGRRCAVAAADGGCWQSHVVLPVASLVPVPTTMTDAAAATLFVNPLTALALTQHLRRGDVLLQSAAASELGKMIIRLCRQRGITTINLVRRAHHMAPLQAQGAHHVLVYDAATGQADDLQREVHACLQGRLLKHAIDPVGGQLPRDLLHCLAPHGRLVCYGTLDLAPLQLSPRELMTRGLSLEGFWLRPYLERCSIVQKLKLVSQARRLVQQGVLATTMGATFPASEFSAALAAAYHPGRQGKVLLRL